MARNAIYRVKMRRRREGKTNYRKRLAYLKSGKPRAVVRKTLRYVIVQIVEYHDDGDKILVGVNSSHLKKYGWKGSFKNTPAAYLTGYLAGKLALKKGIEEAVLDIGLQSPVKGSRVFAALKGMVDAGLYVPHSEEVYPSEDRIKGEHISEEIAKMFEEVKAKMEV
ncbi:50S ribosomal protein L18 [Candidatus Aciduliprofundum boonei]|uniref:Large ribosomal subunit protein uL18 n=1 Tax=Aciduliprofundum boonei (strain DSM 19572 / T469) TaxID=439481 RepID=B5IBI0_ACIB4|nr:50S ribosomal protein L18 [Candidatus Aciduliprofundum boonei]ADD09308.1 ribosomal protein L18P/L5E [Aciduliprofundum boonei T469]EDY36612.1 ribosomal L18p/L5e family [Aciduliprofundum boonei T469]HII55223.1 50S ribosomal protein L18 [Candidatus Aciduliprofundum boonei]